ncbi:MAG: type II toxin-antitoxin system RelE/ParE family toxin [Spirochaetaceae bacterium]|jgi:putative addiction module killer protein|nr:type II toxin-antitoxin system RelE/ParE family toxin [Spirochaetaceae bacterium]
MIVTKETEKFAVWFINLDDEQARAHVRIRAHRLSLGLTGDCKPVGEGVSELRIDYGPGYRVYFKDTGQNIIILFCGGDKSTQDADIATAKNLAKMPLEVKEWKP